MVTIGFWNVDAQRNRALDDRQLAQHAAQLVIERSLDMLFLVECELPIDVLTNALSRNTPYFPVACSKRFKVLARFDPRYLDRPTLPIPSDRFDIWHLSLPLQERVIIGVVHGLDKGNNTASKQELFLQQFAAAVSYVERTLGHDRVVVFGDFNANPFESPIAGLLGMHAVSSGRLAVGEPREMLGQFYRFFYNPMWNLFGDRRGGVAPATYYYRGSDPHELYWHMLDQVLIRPSMIERFPVEDLEIVADIGGISLLSKSGIPDWKRFSDHLPVVFSLDLTVSSLQAVPA